LGCVQRCMVCMVCRVYVFKNLSVYIFMVYIMYKK